MWVRVCHSIRVKAGQHQVSILPGILSDLILVRWLAVHTKLAGPPAPSESTVFPSHFTVGVLALHTSAPCPAIYGLWGSKLGPYAHLLYTLSHLPSSATGFNKALLLRGWLACRAGKTWQSGWDGYCLGQPRRERMIT